jgi:4-hydroxybenzoate polyprenyltransferase
MRLAIIRFPRIQLNSGQPLVKSLIQSRYYRLLRPVAWICFLLPFAVGFGISAGSAVQITQIALAFASFIFWMSFSFTVNAIYDREVDCFHDGSVKDINLSNQPIVTGEISIREARIIAFSSLSVSIFLASLVNTQFLLAILLANFLGYIYSAPPRVKAIPLMDVVCNSLASVVAFYAGLMIGGVMPELDVCIAAFVLASVFYVPTVVSDYKFDSMAGLKTTAVFFGPEKVIKSLYILMAIAVLSWVHVLFSTDITELKILSSVIIPYTIAFTFLINMQWDRGKLNVSPRVLLVPFGIISTIFIFYGFIKTVN